MYTVTYPLEVGQEVDLQLQITKELAGEVLNAYEAFVGETIDDFQMYLIQNLEELQSPTRCIYELLLLGCSWRYYYTALSPGNSFKELFCNLYPRKEKFRPRRPEYNLKNLVPVLDWMESAGEYIGERQNLRIWREFYQNQDPEMLQQHLQKTLVFADWFKTSSKHVTGDREFEGEKLLKYVKLVGLEITGQP